jgi:hypothetical protein
MKRYETKRYSSETKRNGTLKNYKIVKRNGTKRYICETKRNETDQNNNVLKHWLIGIELNYLFYQICLTKLKN